MSRSLKSLVSKKATNKEVLNNGKITNFVNGMLEAGEIGNLLYKSNPVQTDKLKNGEEGTILTSRGGGIAPAWSSIVLKQTNADADLINVSNNGKFAFKTKTNAGNITTPLSLTTNTVTISPNNDASGLNGLVCESAIFGRNDTGSNTFSGILGYTRHPIGWTISEIKDITTLVSTVAIDVIKEGTPITAFNNLSNGVWKIGCICNNGSLGSLGNMTFMELRWLQPIGATVINSTIGQLFHQYGSNSLVNMSQSYPELIIRTTGNGTTGISCSFTSTFSGQPKIKFNIWAIKIA
jgi:hypothetical protein